MNLTKTLASLKQEFSQVRSVRLYFKRRKDAAKVIEYAPIWSMIVKKIIVNRVKDTIYQYSEN